MDRAQLSLFSDFKRSPSLRDVADTVRESGIEGLSGAEARADHARYQEVAVRSALTGTAGMPFRWALNPYRGCTHACEDRYARKYQRHLELGVGEDFSTFILVKKNLPEMLSRELARTSWQRETVAVGTATDGYQPIEGHYKLTRRCLEILADARTPFSLVTKGPMVLRDMDVLLRATRAAGCQVFMSVPSVDERAWSELEPGTAPPAQRLRAIGELARAGIDAGVLMMPLVPGLTTSRSGIERTVAAIAASGARLGGVDVVRFDPGVREHFFAFLEREHPELLRGYHRLYWAGSRVPDAYGKAVKAVVSDVRRAAPVPSAGIPRS